MVHVFTEDGIDVLSGVFTVADCNDFAVKVIQKLGEFFFCVLNDIGDLYIVKSTNNRTASDTLDKTKFLPCFCCNVNGFKLVIFT